MPEYEKRHIAVSPTERRQLEEGKQRYEDRAGHADWGTFLGVAAGVGLAALGIYALARASQQNATTWQIVCPNRDCGATFPVVVDSPPHLAQVPCPNCGTELIVDFSGVLLSTNRHSRHAPSLKSNPVIDLYCAQCGRQMEVTVTAGADPQGITYLQCPFCGGVATYGIGEAQFERNRR